MSFAGDHGSSDPLLAVKVHSNHDSLAKTDFVIFS